MQGLGTLGGIMVLLMFLAALCVIWVAGWAIGTVCGLLLPEGDDEIGE